MTPQLVQFYSEECLIQGHLYLPEGEIAPQSLPIIVLCHGFAAVKEMLLPPYAQTFAQAGFAVLCFDYRGFGESEGIRGSLIPRNQITDIRNAITFMQSLPQTNSSRIGLWGSSYGGAHVVSTMAEDARILCGVVQLAFGDGERVISHDKTEAEIQKLKDSFQKSWEKQVTTNRTLKMPVSKFLTDSQSQEFFKENVGKFAALSESLPFLTMKETFEYKPEKKLHGIQKPIFFVGAELDEVNPLSETMSMFEKAKEPKQLYIVPQASHYAVYEGSMFADVVARECDWFTTYLQ